MEFILIWLWLLCGLIANIVLFYDAKEFDFVVFIACLLGGALSLNEVLKYKRPGE